MGRDYPPNTVLSLVGDHHALEPSQRLAIERGVCSDAQYRRHVVRELEVDDVTRRPLVIDAIDVVRTVATAVAGGPLVQCVDGVMRDLEDATSAISEPDAALERIGKALAVLSPSKT